MPGTETIGANATFAADDTAVRCDTIDVDAQHRRLSIANELYRLTASIY